MYKLTITIERPNDKPFELTTTVLNLNLLTSTLKAVIEEVDPNERRRQIEIDKAIDFKLNHSCPPTYAEGQMREDLEECIERWRLLAQLHGIRSDNLEHLDEWKSGLQAGWADCLEELADRVEEILWNHKQNLAKLVDFTMAGTVIDILQNQLQLLVLNKIEEKIQRQLGIGLTSTIR